MSRQTLWPALLTVNLTPEDKATLQQLANRRSMKLGTLARIVLVDYLASQPDPAIHAR